MDAACGRLAKCPLCWPAGRARPRRRPRVAVSAPHRRRRCAARDGFGHEMRAAQVVVKPHSSQAGRAQCTGVRLLLMCTGEARTRAQCGRSRGVVERLSCRHRRAMGIGRWKGVDGAPCAAWSKRHQWPPRTAPVVLPAKHDLDGDPAGLWSAHRIGGDEMRVAQAAVTVLSLSLCVCVCFCLSLSARRCKDEARGRSVAAVEVVCAAVELQCAGCRRGRAIGIGRRRVGDAAACAAS